MARPFAVIALTACLLSATQLAAQEETAAADDTTRVVIISEKSAFAAGALEWMIPTAGYAYAGHWARGLPPTAVRLVGLVLWFDDQVTTFGESPPCGAQCGVGTALLVGGTIWAIVDAAATARRTNDRKRAALLEASLTPSVGGAGLRLAVRVPVGRQAAPFLLQHRHSRVAPSDGRAYRGSSSQPEPPR